MGKKTSYKGGKGPAPHVRSRTTRSSRGRLVTADDNSTQLLTSQLSLLGLYAAPTIGDGNCLFRALSDQVHGSATLHAEVRRQVCDWIEAHGERYEGFVEVDDGDESDGDRRGKGKGKRKGGGGAGGGGVGNEEDKDSAAGPSKRLQAYLRRMRENATYGGHMELSAFAHMTRRNIKVVQPGLVYVIEWRAGDAPESTPREPESAPQKVKTGNGYYVYEEVLSDDEDMGARDSQQDGGPTVYVAYHDWEHFSSIRNLRGPHSGLPNIQETPPQIDDLPSREEMEREALKESEREKKRERERKEKERKDKANLKAKLKLPPTSTAATPPPLPALSDPKLQQSLLDGTPPISSRSASPFPPPSTTQDSTVEDTRRPDTPLKATASLSASSDCSEHSHSQSHLRSHSRQPHLQGTTPRAQYRSPKRTFDESSASGGEDEGREKRSRVRLGSVSLSARSATGGTGTNRASLGVEMQLDADGHINDDGDADVDVDADIDADADGGADTPGLSAPSSAASASSDSSSELSSPPSSSSSSSPSPAPEPSIAASVAPPTPIKRYQSQTPHPHTPQTPGAAEKGLTRRQRKALGLPKPRRGDLGGPPGMGVGAGGRVSAGKITIPGGRWTGRPASGVAVAGTGPGTGAGMGMGTGTEVDPGDEEWRRNGTGRLDVRGFRELKI